MDNSKGDYHISFFKPTTPQALANRNLVVWFVIIWVVSIFGFQILLKVIEKPTPEPAYVTFQNVWENVTSDAPGEKEVIEFGQASLSVLGKVAIDPGDKAVLDNALSWSLYQLTSDSLKESLIASIQNFEKVKAEITNISDEAYIKLKKSLSAELSPILSLNQLDVRSKILPLELTSANITGLTDDTKEKLPAVMKRYLIHNQSFLTDTQFLGFPFHYFYTAIFLLVLFVGLCWLYCVKTDKLNAKLNIVD